MKGEKEWEREKEGKKEREKEEIEKERGNDTTLSELDSSWAQYEIKDEDDEHEREEMKEEEGREDVEKGKSGDDDDDDGLFDKLDLDQLSVNDSSSKNICNINYNIPGSSNNIPGSSNNIAGMKNIPGSSNSNNKLKNVYNDNEQDKKTDPNVINVPHNTATANSNATATANFSATAMTTAAAQAITANLIAADPITANPITTNSDCSNADAEKEEVERKNRERKQSIAHENGMTECLILLQKCLLLSKYNSDLEYDARLQQKNEHSVLTMGALCDYKTKLLTTIATRAQFDVRTFPRDFDFFLCLHENIFI